jgi:hypothetical protein
MMLQVSGVLIRTLTISARSFPAFSKHPHSAIFCTISSDTASALREKKIQRCSIPTCKIRRIFESLCFDFNAPVEKISCPTSKNLKNVFF